MEKLASNLKLELEEKMGKLEENIIESEDKRKLSRGKRIEELIDKRIKLIKIENLVEGFRRFINDFIFYKKFNLINKVFSVTIIDLEWEKINEEELYKKILSCIEKTINEDTEGEILKSFGSLFSTELTLEKNKAKCLLSGKDIKQIIFLEEVRYNEFREKVLTFIKTILKYELGFIKKEEFKMKSSEAYFNILTSIDLKNIKHLENFSDVAINKISETEEIGKKIKDKVKKWIKNQEKAEELILKSIEEEKYHGVIEYLYFLNENQKELYKNKIKENLSLEIEEIMSEDDRNLKLNKATLANKVIRERLILKRLKRKIDFATETE